MESNSTAGSWELETKAKGRFAFGENWSAFLGALTTDRIERAESSLLQALGVTTLKDVRFLDIGSGSGLSSLAAKRSGASVFSFDYDTKSVMCTEELKRKFFPDDEKWKIHQGSVLDTAFLEGIKSKVGEFEIVYSWGVLHHTGDMWKALDNIIPLVASKGRIFIAIYNDQGWKSHLWRKVKKLYVSLPGALKRLILYPALLFMWGPKIILDCFTGDPLKRWHEYSKERGMSPLYDVIDWIGGYPFEVAKPEAIFEFYRARGFELRYLRTQRGNHGCCEYVFQKS